MSIYINVFLHLYTYVCIHRHVHLCTCDCRPVYIWKIYYLKLISLTFSHSFLNVWYWGHFNMWFVFHYLHCLVGDLSFLFWCMSKFKKWMIKIKMESFLKFFPFFCWTHIAHVLFQMFDAFSDSQCHHDNSHENETKVCSQTLTNAAWTSWLCLISLSRQALMLCTWRPIWQRSNHYSTQ